MLGAGGVRRDEGQDDLRRLGRRQVALRLLGRFLEPLPGHAVLAQVDGVRLHEVLDQEVDDPLVEVLAAEEGVAAGGPHLHHAIADFEDRNIERAAAEVVDRDVLVLLALAAQAIGEGGRGRLVQDATDLEPGDHARVLGGLTLGIVEVGGDRDDGLIDALAQVFLGALLQLLQDQGGDLGRGIQAIGRADVGVAVGRLGHLEGRELPRVGHFGGIVLSADQPLDRVERVGGVRDGLALGDLADQAVALRGEGDHGWGGSRPFRVGDDDRLAVLDHGDTGVRGAEIDADNSSHEYLLVGNRHRDPSVVFARLLGHFDQGRTDEPVAHDVSLTVARRDRAILNPGHRLVRKGLVTKGIEFLPGWVLHLHAAIGQGAEDVLECDLHPGPDFLCRALGPERLFERVE